MDPTKLWAEWCDFYRNLGDSHHSAPIPPRTEKQVKELRRKCVESYAEEYSDLSMTFTCDNCPLAGGREYCPYIFDLYNTNGDCLVMK